MKQSVVIATVVILMGSAAANRCVDPNACTGKCRELCNARTLAGMAEAAVSFKPGTNVEAIARRLFTSDAFMAVVPVSAFEGGKLAMEYLLTFSRQEAPLPPVATVVELKTRHLQLSATAATLVFDLVLSNPVDARYQGVFRGVSMMAFNNVSRITHITIDYTHWAESIRAINFTATRTPLVVGVAKQMLCTAHSKYCVGSNRQWDTIEECLAFLDTVPFEAPETRLAGNNILCRWFHGRILDLDPGVHCAHIGPKGGGKCVDDPAPYTVAYQDKHLPRFAFNSISDPVAKMFARFLE